MPHGFQGIHPLANSSSLREIFPRPRSRLFILNLPCQGGNGGTSLSCNFLFLSFSPSLPLPPLPLALFHGLHSVRSFFFRASSAAIRSSPSIIYYFETSKTLLSASLCPKNFIPFNLTLRLLLFISVRRILAPRKNARERIEAKLSSFRSFIINRTRPGRPFLGFTIASRVRLYRERYAIKNT